MTRFLATAALLFVAAAPAVRGQDTPEGEPGAYARALEAYRAGNYGAAVEILEGVSERDPGRSRWMYGITFASISAYPRPRASPTWRHRSMLSWSHRDACA